MTLKPKLYISCVVTFLVAIPLIYMVSRTINQLCIRNNINNSTTQRENISKPGKLIPTCSVLSLISFTLMVVLSFVTFITVIIMSGYTYTTAILINSWWSFYGIGVWIMMFTYTSRIDITFRNSKELSTLSYPKWLINLLYIWIILIGTLGIVLMIFTTLFQFALVAYIGIITLLLYIIFTIFLLYLFSKQLVIVMLKRLESNHNNSPVSNATNEIEDDKQQSIVIELVTLKSIVKYCLLVLQGIMSTYIGNILVIISLIHEHVPTYTFVAIDILINAISLYFMFSFNNEQYNKLCSKCHDCCEQICIEWIYRNNNKNLSVQDRQQYETLILSE